MNEHDPLSPPPMPSPWQPGAPRPEPPPDPTELAPIRGLGSLLEAILRRPRGVLHHLSGADAARLILCLLGLALGCAALYGVVVGAFSGGMQFWAAPVKITFGLLICAGICLPSLYVFACLSGTTARFTDVLGMVSGLLALMTILLFSFAPVAWVFSQSTESVAAMAALHLLFWIVATYFGARFLYRGMARLGARSVGAFYFWMTLFVVVALQMMTALRPLVGKADTFLPEEKKFFLAHWADTLDGKPEPAAKKPAGQPRP